MHKYVVHIYEIYICAYSITIYIFYTYNLCINNTYLKVILPERNKNISLSQSTPYAVTMAKASSEELIWVSHTVKKKGGGVLNTSAIFSVFPRQLVEQQAHQHCHMQQPLCHSTALCICALGNLHAMGFYFFAFCIYKCSYWVTSVPNAKHGNQQPIMYLLPQI